MDFIPPFRFIATIFICGLLIGLVISSAFAITRDELYRQFGPKVVEAIVLIVKDEINILRSLAGLPERTNQQLLNAIEAKLELIEDYNWMD